MEEQQNALKIAVIEEQMNSLREQHRTYSLSFQNRFDRMEKKLDELAAVIDRGKGAYAASLVLAGLIGGVAIKMMSLFVGYFQRPL